MRRKEQGSWGIGYTSSQPHGPGQVHGLYQPQPPPVSVGLPVTVSWFMAKQATVSSLPHTEWMLTHWELLLLLYKLQL